MTSPLIRALDRNSVLFLGLLGALEPLGNRENRDVRHAGAPGSPGVAGDRLARRNIEEITHDVHRMGVRG